MVSFQQVSKTYPGHVEAVCCFDLEVADQELLAVVGPSGSGKSTLLRMLAGLEEVSSGTILLNHQNVEDLSPTKRNIAMVFQNYALFPHMSVRKNIAFGLKERGFSRNTIKQLVDDAAEMLGIDHCLPRKPESLSGGERQRVAFGRAIVRNPSVFLFDEPLSNLDAKLRVSMRNEIRTLQRRLKTTMIYVTHDQSEAMAIADRVCVIDHGITQQVDTPSNIYNHPNNVFVAEFIGSPSMNLIPGTISVNGTDEVTFCCEKTTVILPEKYYSSLAPYNQKEIKLGIRAEHIGIVESVEGNEGISGKIIRQEYLGHEVHLQLESLGRKLMARTSSACKYKDDCSVYLKPQYEHACFFDCDTGIRIN